VKESDQRATPAKIEDFARKLVAERKRLGQEMEKGGNAMGTRGP
jgi:hypothetical protein